MPEPPHSVETLFEQIANELGFEKLDERIPVLPDPLTCWGILMFVVVYLHRRYERVLDEIDVDSRTTDPSAFETLAPPKLRLGFYVVLIAYALWQFVSNLGMETVTQIGGSASWSSCRSATE